MSFWLLGSLIWGERDQGLNRAVRDQEDEQEDEHAVDAGKSRRCLSILRLLVDVRGGVPAPEEEDSQRRSGRQTVEVVQLQGVEPLGGDGVGGSVPADDLAECPERKGQDDEVLDEHEDPLEVRGTPDATSDHEGHQQQPQYSNDGDQTVVVRGIGADPAEAVQELQGVRTGDQWSGRAEQDVGGQLNPSRYPADIGLSVRLTHE